MNHSTVEKQRRFLELFEPLQPQLQRFVLAMTRNEELAKDIIGETILIAYERLDSLRHDAAFLSFLFTIATRVHRKRRKEQERTTGIDEEGVLKIFDAATPPDVAADIAAMYQALQLLPEKQREGILLYDVIGLTTQEIRDIQGGTLVGVRVRIARGRKKLARLLGVDETPLPESKQNPSAETSLSNDAINLYAIGTSHE